MSAPRRLELPIAARSGCLRSLLCARYAKFMSQVSDNAGCTTFAPWMERGLHSLVVWMLLEEKYWAREDILT